MEENKTTDRLLCAAFRRVPLIETYKGDSLPTTKTHNFYYIVWVYEDMLKSGEVDITYHHKNITLNQLVRLHGKDRLMAHRIQPGIMGHVLRIERVWKRKNWVVRLFNSIRSL